MYNQSNQIQTITIPINNGYYQYKSINNIIFKSRIEKCLCSDIETTADILVYDNETYTVGDGKINLDGDKTTTEFTKICVLNMLSKFCGSEGKFNVILTTPPLMFQQQSEVLPMYLKGTYNIVANKESKKITIDSVKVLPETFLTYASNNINNKFKRKNLLIFDIGGVTSNIVIIKQGKFNLSPDNIITIKKGMYHIDTEIAQYLNGKYPLLDCNFDDIEYARDNNGLIDNNTDENIFEIEKDGIENFYMEHIEMLLQECTLKKFNYSLYDCLITGGGGKILYPYIKDNFIKKAILSIDPIFDNLKGLEIIAKELYK
jgi:hypothetical protein